MMIQDAWQSSLNKATLPTDLIATWAERDVQESDSGIQKRLEQVGRSLMKGYHTAITDELEAIAPKLNEIDEELRGFAYEGVGMGLAQRDFLTPTSQNRIAMFVAGDGAAYANMVYVGLGLMLARVGRPIEPHLQRLDNAKGWLLVDGYGYYQGMFYWRDSLDSQVISQPISGYTRSVFDQGLGRSIWFVDGGDVNRIARTIDAFSLDRREDLWGGVGYACAYAGGAKRATIEALGNSAGAYRLHLAQGTAYAAKSRQCLGNQSVYTELACQVLWGVSADAVADSLATHGETPESPLWQHYRARIPHPVRATLAA
ncbi:DUF1702 family protein [Nostoc sp. C052]|uniref:DUF1702 family protein n=1 Tax=Nostoc sp. C052 TaxID=2576902 RepID=UPI0015C2CFB3|nr:DUF1702 family protein [Nostoc sp. C052]QLE40034.1 DUF1702 family protein [Nostoc sp. C052]